MDKQNQIKSALADAGRTCLWLAEQMEYGSVAVSNPCTNTYQSDFTDTNNDCRTV